MGVQGIACKHPLPASNVGLNPDRLDEGVFFGDLLKKPGAPIQVVGFADGANINGRISVDALDLEPEGEGLTVKGIVTDQGPTNVRSR